MESQCKGDCIKFQDELWQWKNRAVVAEYRALELEQELKEIGDFIKKFKEEQALTLREAELIKTKVKEMIEQMKGE